MTDDYIKDRILACADYYINNNSTVRKTAKVFNISKSTVHINLSKDLKKLDKFRYNLVRKIMNNNQAQKHIRGGLATQKKFKNI